MTGRLFKYLQQKRFFSRFYLDFKVGLRIRKPRLALRLARNYFDILILRKRLLRTVDFAPTYACNCNCEHCFAMSLLDEKKEKMTIEDYRNTALQAKALGAVHFAFQGGEPLLLTDLEDMVRAVDPRDCFVSITTNGFLLTNERIARLKRAGLDMVTISIDSGHSDEHDAFRNAKGLFKKSIEAIKDAKRHGLVVTVNTTVTHSTLKSGGFKEMVDICDRLKIKLNLLFPAISGRWSLKTGEMLSKEEHKRVREIIDSRTFIRRDLDANYVTYGCGAVKEMVYITAYGEVLPCAFIHVSLGNIKKESLKACLDKALNIPYFKGYYPVCPPMEDMEFINTCMSKIAGSKNLPANFSDVFTQGKS
jgi:MoaA/NifB/PqqE/SkfB family radical SAM enzyme